MNINDYYQQAAEFSPNPLQEEVWKSYYQGDGHPAFLVRAGTGTGKTEAVLLPALADSVQRRIIMVLPSKALIEDMGERVKKIGERLSKNRLCDLNITVDMGGSCRRFSCRHGKAEANTYPRHLFADDVIITTLDKFLFRLFGYGEKIKSYIFPHRVFGSSLGKRPFVIFDEAHEYEGVAFGNFIKLLEALFIKGKDLCVMSATLPPRFASFLTSIDATDGSLAEQQAVYQEKAMKMVSQDKFLSHISSLSFSKEIVAGLAHRVREHYNGSKRIIARTEFVSDLIKLYDKLKEFNPLIYHGRLTSRQRRDVIHKLIECQDKDQGFLVLATSAIEAGCDIDAHLIVTEICNPDSLVQLAGRLNRKGVMNDAELVIVGDKIKPIVSCLDKDSVKTYLDDLKGMNGVFDPDELKKYFDPPKGDWMGEILFDMLWEYVYEGDLTSKPLWDRGILVTRSWEPSVTLCTGLEQETKLPMNPVQVGISRLAAQTNKWGENLKNEKVSEYLSVEDDGTWHAEVHRAFFNADRWEESRWSVYPFPEYRISAYEKTVLCVIGEEFTHLYFDNVLGYKRIPKVFLRGYKSGFERILQHKPLQKRDGTFKVENKWVKDSGSIWYLER
ncbi:MAG: CRISPR-associated helicase Cas3' [Deltaproteobacteria bacterium]|nr:CRISPR-associated helicase Cas3' [Deltaproteobacteria bacterium]